LDATSLPSAEKYDIIFVFDVIHDAADPVRLLKLIRNGLKDDGVFICMDIKSSKDPKNNSAFAYGMRYVLERICDLMTYQRTNDVMKSVLLYDDISG